MGSIKHRKTSTVPNAPNDTRRIGGDDWNEEHEIDLEVSDVAGLEARLIPVDQVVQYRDDALAYRNEAAGSAAAAANSATEAANVVGSLAADDGATKIGTGSGLTVQQELNAKIDALALSLASTVPAYDYTAVELQSILDNGVPLQDYVALRAYADPDRAKGVRVTGLYVSPTSDGLAGAFKVNPLDTTSPDNGGTIIVDALGRRWYRLFTGSVRAAWFGVDHKGLVDSTARIQAAGDYMYATRSGLSSGMGALEFDRGVVLADGDMSFISARGLTIRGQGFGATELRRTIDTGVMFSPSTYSYFGFEDLSINHTGVVADRATWTNTCLNLYGINNIGQNFFMRRCRIGGFSKQIDYGARNVNGDTNFFSDCTFGDFGTFLEAVNNQGIINHFSNCTWQGTGPSVFKVSGFGHTHFDSCNVLVGGKWLDLSGSGGPQSIYLMTNCKFEFWPQGASVGTTRLVAMSNAMNVKIIFKGGGLAGSTPDPTIYQIENRCSGGGIEFDGGNWSPNVKMRHYKQVLTSVFGTPTYSVATKFKNCTISPSPANLVFDATGGTNQSFAGAVWENCQDRTNLCVTGIANGQTFNSAVPADSVINRATFTGASINGALLNGTTPVTYAMPHYGQMAFLRAVRVLIHSQAVVVSGTIKVFSDAAKTVQIGATIPINAGASTTPTMYELAIPANAVVTEGVYVEMTNTNGVYAYGRIYIETMSV